MIKKPFARNHYEQQEPEEGGAGYADSSEGERHLRTAIKFKPAGDDFSTLQGGSSAQNFVISLRPDLT
jgi:hypothetical protein